MKHIIDPDIAPPFGRYSHAVEIPAGARILSLAGQVGCRADGTVPASAGEQTELIFQNLKSLLGKAGMEISDLVELTIYAVAKEDLAEIRAVRDRWIGDTLPALSLVIVAALGRAEWRLEMDGTAAKVG